MSQSAVMEPKLAKPGAGLPFVEWAVAKYIIFPRLFKSTTPEQAIARFEQVTDQIIAVTDPLETSVLNERRLIPRLQGLEDSSRYWSVAMTLQHLIVVSRSMRQVVTTLSQGKTIDRKASIADLKPAADIDPATVRDKFKNAAQSLVADMRTCDLKSPASTVQKFDHPWFGPLNAEQWLVFAAPHQKIHYNQIQEILKRI